MFVLKKSGGSARSRQVLYPDTLKVLKGAESYVPRIVRPKTPAFVILRRRGAVSVLFSTLIRRGLKVSESAETKRNLRPSRAPPRASPTLYTFCSCRERPNMIQYVQTVQQVLPRGIHPPTVDTEGQHVDAPVRHETARERVRPRAETRPPLHPWQHQRIGSSPPLERGVGGTAKRSSTCSTGAVTAARGRGGSRRLLAPLRRRRR